MPDPSIPAWLQALLMQAYPGRDDMSPEQMQAAISPPHQMFPPPTNPLVQQANQAAPVARQPYNGPFPATTGNPLVDTINNPPRPNPAQVGGASSQSAVRPIPSPQNTNRTANNPRFGTFQYNVPGSGPMTGNPPSGALSRNPIYTYFNPWGQS